jgi:hypothetical protein
MADVKISALTGATTPLAGTEVLPIVQGGATVKVSVANLTAGRTVSVANLSIEGSGYVARSIHIEANLADPAYHTDITDNINAGFTINKVEAGFASTTTVWHNGDFKLTSTGNFIAGVAGQGFTVTSPDGLTTKTITINNAGVLTLI